MKNSFSQSFYQLSLSLAPKYLCKSILADMPWSCWKWVAGWQLALFSCYSLCPIVLSTSPCSRDDCPTAMLRSRPVTWQCLGKRCTCKAEVQGGCWNAWLCSCCELGELRLMTCFAEPCAVRTGVGFFFLFIIFLYCFYWIIQSLFCYYICLLYNFSVFKNMFSFPDACTVCFLWIADF